ncbi:MAG: metallophosphoesterase family protein [Bacteroidales bacterium]|jgi:serine/threonine protein phosphatase 1|nr:metallophosphoesterase family protein [Bacteroidales bacterium]
MNKIWIIPDIHGCSKTLRALFEYYIIPSRDDDLYFLGDYIDRGPDSKGVLDFIMDLQEQGFRVHPIMGNHEESCVKAFLEEQNRGKNFLGFRKRNLSKIAWRQYGGKETMESFGVQDLNDMPRKYVEWMDNLPVFIELPAYLLVHAGLDFSLSEPMTDEQSMLWLRDFDPQPEKIGGRILVHGHVPISLEDIFMLRDRPGDFGHIDLDNGVYMAGREGFGNLVALELNSMELYSQYNLDY